MAPPNDFRHEYLNTLLGFLWQSWSSIGVAGHQRGRMVADPEALLLLTCSVGRYDPRLFDEVLDWRRLNGRFINVQRLSNIVRSEPFRGGPVLAAVAGWMAARGAVSKWKRLSEALQQAPEGHVADSAGYRAGGRAPRARESGVKAGQEYGAGRDAVPLFMLPDGRALPVIGPRDPHFLEKGFIRSPVEVRGLSSVFSADAGAARLLQLRALFGVNARCDALIYLALRGSGHPREVAREIYFSQKSVHAVLADLECAGAVVSSRAGREREYRLTPTGAALVGDITEQFNWVNWPLLLCAAETAWAVLSGDGVSGLDREDAESLRPLLERLIRARWAEATEIELPASIEGQISVFHRLFQRVALGVGAPT